MRHSSQSRLPVVSRPRNHAPQGAGATFQVVVFLLFCHLAGAADQPSIDELPDTDPAAQLRAFEPAEGLEINLFASEPMLKNPVQMNWDQRGRLWVVCSTTYPHIIPGEEPDDQIVILEDTDGDGRADSSTTFAGGLHIPTGLLPVPNGVLVANSTEVLLLEDTDGDDRADKRTVVLSGFGTEDTHHLLHTFRMGPTGRVHFQQSIYIHSDVETPHGVRRLDGGGMWNFHYPSRRLEVFYKGLINPWGLAFDHRGQAFATDGAGSQGIHDVFPGAVYRTSPGASRVLPGLNPGQPKLCGLDTIESPHWPEDWQHSLVTCDFRGGRINRFEVEPSGSSHRSRQQGDLLTSTHRAFRPVDVLQGPDGALYIADWYNPIIQHGEVDFRDPRRDREHGRIWRLSRQGGELDRQPDFERLAIPQLVGQLDRPNRWTRDFARRELGRREAAAVHAALGEWLGNEGADLEPWRRMFEAALVGAHLDEPDSALLMLLLGRPEPAARAGAMRVLYDFPALSEGMDEQVAAAVRDPEPAVRLAALSVLREWRSSEGIELALSVLEQEMDEPIDFLLETILREQKEVWLPKMLAGRLDVAPEAMVYALGVAGGDEVVDPLLDALADGALDGAAAEGALRVIAESADAGQLGSLFEWLESQAGDQILVAGLKGLESAAERGVRPPAEKREGLLKLLDSESRDVRLAAVPLLGAWRLQGAGDRLFDWARQGEDEVLAEAAIASLARLPKAQARERLALLAAEGQVLAVRGRAAEALLRTDPVLAVDVALEVAEDASGKVDEIAAMWTALFRNKGAVGVLVARLEERGDLPTDVAAEALRLAGTRGLSEDVTEALREAGNVQRMDRQLTEAELAQMVARVGSEGDPLRGERIYRRTEMQCTVCHAIGGAGGVIGPDLISLGASAPVDYIIEAMLEPSAVIKEGYHMTIVTTEGGDVVAGGLVLDGEREVVIRDASGVEHRIPTDLITNKTISPASMMPPGLTNSLREDEFIDLIRFMSELGTDGGFRVNREPVVRSWRMLREVKGAEVEAVRHGGLDLLGREPERFGWAPLTSLVSGAVPLAEVPSHRALFPWRPKVLQFDAEVGPDGKLILEIDDVEGVIVVIGDRSYLTPEPRMELDLEPGEHVVTLVVQTGIGDPDRELKVRLP